jgi:hypothetical protein
MEQERRNAEALLLDWHLDRLDQDTRAWLEAELQRDVELRAKSDRLGKVLRPLDDWRVTPPGPNLADRVLQYVATHSRENAVPVAPPPQPRHLFPFPSLAMRDLIAAAACIILLIGVAVPGASELRRRSQRATCSRHLASIFGGVASYRQDFNDALPYAGYMANASWLPEGAAGRPYASNSRHLYLLLKLGCGPTPEDFVCPASETAVPMAMADVAMGDDFPSTCNVSYAALNLGSPNPNVRPMMPIVYIGDTNPLFVGARFNASVDPYRTNSPAHGGRGQTVLTLDGSARWTTRPVYGPDQDNLWLIRDIREYTGIEAPTDPGDVQLVPGFPATDPEVCRALRQ